LYGLGHNIPEEASFLYAEGKLSGQQVLVDALEGWPVGQVGLGKLVVPAVIRKSPDLADCSEFAALKFEDFAKFAKEKILR
jgi:hypothetical protein